MTDLEALEILGELCDDVWEDPDWESRKACELAYSLLTLPDTIIQVADSQYLTGKQKKGLLKVSGLLRKILSEV